MSYPTQAGVLKRLQIETRRAGREAEDKQARRIERTWRSLSSGFQGRIASTYRDHFGRGRWSLARGTRLGTLGVMMSGIREESRRRSSFILDDFASGLRAVGELERQRQAWMLDNVTPPSYRVRSRVVESAGNEPSVMDTLAQWMSAYEDALASNLRLGMLNESSMTDAMAEVDATRFGGFTMMQRLMGLWTNKALDAQRDARKEFYQANAEAMSENVWLTLEDLKVCVICKPLDGKPIADVGYPPAHFFCRCYSAFVPKPWAELLRSGSDKDRALALELEQRGLAPQTMAVAGPDGEPEAFVTVDFGPWQRGERAMAVSGGL